MTGIEIDAARYRYLRDFAQSKDEADGTFRWWFAFPSWAMPRARSLDESVDAGMREQALRTGEAAWMVEALRLLDEDEQATGQVREGA